jgi:hypothetical protein
MKTYAEIILEPFGFSKGPNNQTQKNLTLVFQEHIVVFSCVCPSYPDIRALGCPLHHSGPGGSWPVEKEKSIANLI